MKPINEVYPEEAQEEQKRGACYGPSDYTPMLDSMGYETLLRVDDGDYQGDSRLILRDGSRYGVLIFGWGSCSGCDALQACHSMKDIDDLRTSLRDSVKWFESQEECLRYFETHDWEGDYCWHADETRQFVREGKQLLTEAPNTTMSNGSAAKNT